METSSVLLALCNVRGIHCLPVDSPLKCQRRQALMFSFMCVWTNREGAGYLRPYNVDGLYIETGPWKLIWNRPVSCTLTCVKLLGQEAVYNGTHHHSKAATHSVPPHRALITDARSPFESQCTSANQRQGTTCRAYEARILVKKRRFYLLRSISIPKKYRLIYSTYH